MTGFGAGPSRRIGARWPTAKPWPAFAPKCSPPSVQHLGRPPQVAPGLPSIGGHERIVARAREWIAARLGEPIGINDIAAAAGASRRTLSRAFFDVLEESPQAYVTRLRLHQIRSELVRAAVAPRIAEASNRWAVSELGRMSGRYKALFGELPSETARLGKTRALLSGA